MLFESVKLIWIVLQKAVALKAQYLLILLLFLAFANSDIPTSSCKVHVWLVLKSHDTFYGFEKIRILQSSVWMSEFVESRKANVKHCLNLVKVDLNFHFLHKMLGWKVALLKAVPLHIKSGFSVRCLYFSIEINCHYYWQIYCSFHQPVKRTLDLLFSIGFIGFLHSNFASYSFFWSIVFS